MTTPRKRWDKWRDDAEGARYIIEGLRFTHVEGVHRKAVELGFDGCEGTIMGRLKNGVDTWAELAKPVNPNQAEAAKRTVANKYDEMDAVIAALDARKRAMGITR